jgi:hypothetical protein
MLQYSSANMILHAVNLHYSKSYTHFTETNPARYRAQKCSTDLQFDALSHTEPPCFITQSNNKNIAETALFYQPPTSLSCTIMLLAFFFQNGPLTYARSSIKLLPLPAIYHCSQYSRPEGVPFFPPSSKILHKISCSLKENKTFYP